MKAKKVIYFICSLVVLAILGFMTYIGLAGLITALPVPDFIFNFDMFYGIFWGVTLESVIFTLPLLVGVVFAFTQFCEKNWKLTFLIIEIVFLIIILLHGFGAF